MNELILYTTKAGRGQIKLLAKDQTVWLSQREMAQLFDASTDNISFHLKNIYEDGELSREATTEESSVVQKEGEREVRWSRGVRIGRAFSPPITVRPQTWGWYRAGPLALNSTGDPSRMPVSSRAKGAPSYRPAATPQDSDRADQCRAIGPTYSP